MIIAIEGVSCTGKTTLAGALARHFGTEPIDCYRHVAKDPSLLGEPVALSHEQLLNGLAAHLAVEEERLAAAQRILGCHGTVVMDRSVDTTLAHLTAMGELSGIDAREPARQLVQARAAQGRVAVPDLTLLLRASPAELQRRARRRPELPGIYYAPNFARHFNAHFDNPVTLRCVPIDVDAPTDAVLAMAHACLQKAGA